MKTEGETITMTQCEAILKRLQSGYTLTPLDALNDPTINSFRLAARIKNLRDVGHDIETVMTDRGGRSVAAYRLRRIVEEDWQMRLVA